MLIANAIENLAKVIARHDQAEPKFRALVEELSHSSIKNRRGEIPYRLFMQLKDKLGLDRTDPLMPGSRLRDSQ